MIQELSHDISPALAEENAVHAQSVLGLSPTIIAERWPTVDDYLGSFATSAEARQLDLLIAQLPDQANLIDLGAGMGRPTFYLASRGNQANRTRDKARTLKVSAIEPSRELCQLQADLATVYQLPVDAINGTAESAHQLPAESADACLFHASLHHCDDPARALANAYRLLKPAGKLFVYHEPHLPFFRSKAWFENTLASGALVSGDYGGNEHIYHQHEYVEMIKQAGFSDIMMSPLFRYRYPKEYLSELELAHASWRSRLLRRVFYSTMQMAMQLGVINAALQPARPMRSALQWSYQATRT